MQIQILYKSSTFEASQETPSHNPLIYDIFPLENLIPTVLNASDL
jgi:hypothetical protein